MAKKQKKPVSARSGGKKSLERLDRPVTLTGQVEQTLRRAIAEDAFPGDRLPTTIELADQLGVSRETVRLALESLQNEGLLVKHRRRGTFINAPSVPAKLVPLSKTIGYLQADYSNEQGKSEDVMSATGNAMLNGAIAEAGEAGLQIVARSARIVKLRLALDELCSQNRLRGVILASIAEEKPLSRLIGKETPTVLLDHDLHLPKINSIQPDAFGRGKMAVGHLAELGHRRIALAQWHQNDLNPWLQRGYREGMREAKLPRRRVWENLVSIDPVGATEAIDAILATSPQPTAVICFNNALANFIIDAATNRGLRVPEDLSVIGGGGGDVLGLTCMQLDWHDLGRQAVKMLVRAMEGGDKHTPEHRLVPFQLQQGRTICAPNWDEREQAGE